jgi:hypothetical protein
MSREIIDREHVGRLMHESWSRTKRAQGFHGPSDKCPLNPSGRLQRHRTNATLNNCVCSKQHADLIPWDDLPEKQKDINRHAFDDVLPYFERLLTDEREKVREMCAVVCDDMDGWRSWVGIPGFAGAPTEADAAAGYLADKIRQLDLTKDLAASSTEERKE